MLLPRERPLAPAISGAERRLHVARPVDVLASRRAHDDWFWLILVSTVSHRGMSTVLLPVLNVSDAEVLVRACTEADVARAAPFHSGDGP
jgi:hypothetical protein